VAQNCPKCGAAVLTACPNCGLRIRGDYFVPGVIAVSTASRPSFCDGCGSAEHAPFYLDACGFRPTDAGLIHLDGGLPE
jgi:hypothetical protein